MKSYFLILALLFTAACSTKSKKTDIYNPDTYLSKQQQRDVIAKTIRYSTKLAPNATHENKFDKEFDWYYDRAIQEYDLKAYYIGPDSMNYFLMTRKARSINVMREGIGGKVKIEKNGKVSVYEEVFRTWKMPVDTLNKRGLFLFERLVDGRDLSLYYTKYQRDRYIEFPDERFVFDKNIRRWKDVELDSVMAR